MPTGFTKKRVLVIDDDEQVLIALEALLERAGYNTTTAWSGHEGLKWLRTGKFDLVLMGDHLWDIADEEILEEIRRMAIQPLVMLTEAEPIPADVSRYVELGASGLIGKWASPEEILAAVDGCLTKTALEKVVA